jgi:glucan biosynthesis protein C
VDTTPAVPHRPRVTSPSARRYDLDWIRVSAFGLLILYHVGLVYAPYDWHIQSVHTFEWMREAVLITNPWRLTLLFLVSGAALRFMTLRRTPGQVARARFERLGPPLLLGVLLLVPIQSWIEAMDKGSWDQGFAAWLMREFSWTGLMNGVPTNHLWFVIYIAAYSLVVVALMRWPDRLAVWEEKLERLLPGWRVLLIPILYLIAIRLLLFPLFGVTNKLEWDWYNHALSLGAFLFGFLMVRREGVWRDLERFRWIALGVAAACLPVMMAQVAHPGGGAFWGVPRNVVFAIDQWMVIAAILGFGSKHLRGADGPAIRYLTDAVFTCYLAHQTILVVAVWFIRPLNLPAGVEALSLAVITIAGSLAIYEVVRRVAIVRPIWGLKPDALPTHAHRRTFLIVGVAAPLLALTAVLIAVAAHPGYNHARQYLSELGEAGAPLSVVFNGGVLIAGLMAALAGIGFGLGIMALSRARVASVLTAFAFVLAGVGLVIGGAVPYPEQLHNEAMNLGLGIQLAPLLILWGLWTRKDMPRLKIFLAVVFAVMCVLTLLTKHILFPGAVNDANVGWWERGYAIVLVGWVGVAAFVLERRLKAENDRAADASISP